MDSSSDPKITVMRQIQQAAAVQNARALVDVRLSLPINFLANVTETQRALLRALRAQTRLITVKRRRDVLHAVHGEIHGRLECREQGVRCTTTKGIAAGWRTEYRVVSLATTARSKFIAGNKETRKQGMNAGSKL
jgi:hypothetical protein